jgi:hypothetical protein
MVDWEGEGKQMPDFRKIEVGQNVELPAWAARQQRVFTNWINNKVTCIPFAFYHLSWQYLTT